MSQRKLSLEFDIEEQGESNNIVAGPWVTNAISQTDDGIVVGYREDPLEGILPITVPYTDTGIGNMAVVGKSKSGKTTFLQNVGKQLINSHNIVHYTTDEEELSTLEEKYDDTFVVSADNLENYTLNLFERSLDDEQYIFELVFRAIYERFGEDENNIQADTFTKTLEFLFEEDEANMQHIYEFIKYDDFAEDLIEETDDEEYIEAFENRIDNADKWESLERLEVYPLMQKDYRNFVEDTENIREDFFDKLDAVLSDPGTAILVEGAEDLSESNGMRLIGFEYILNHQMYSNNEFADLGVLFDDIGDYDFQIDELYEDILTQDFDNNISVVRSLESLEDNDIANMSLQHSPHIFVIGSIPNTQEANRCSELFPELTRGEFMSAEQYHLKARITNQFNESVNVTGWTIPQLK